MTGELPGSTLIGNLSIQRRFAFMDNLDEAPEQSLTRGDERERLAQMFEQAPSLMALLREPNHRIVLANQAFQQLFSKTQTVGRTVGELLPDDLSAAAVKRLDEAYRSGDPVRLPAVRLPSRSDEPGGLNERILDLILQPIRDPDGAVTGIFVEGSDVTDRVLAERRLESSFEIKTVGIIYWGVNFGLTQVNDAFLQMTGFTRDEAIGMTWQELTPKEFWPASELAVHQVNTIGEAVPYEKQYFGKDGRRWWGLFAPRRVSSEEVIEFVLDVTERKQGEVALRQLNEALESRVIEQVAARMKTEEALRQSQKLEAIGQLTGGVAHDFNNLLTVIRGAAEMLRRPGLTEEKRERYVEAIADTADRAAKLTGQLLAFSRRQALKPEVFNTGQRIEAIRDMLATVVGARVDLVVETECDVCYVEADPSQFETALVNMSVNARDAMEDAGTLRITIQPVISVPSVRGHAGTNGEFVAISISDTGAGIAQDKLAQIFEPFFTTKAIGKGTGLGLSQVYGFAKQSGGEVAVESEEGRGTTFTMYLPRVAAELGDATTAKVGADSAQGRGHVLVVEDNEQVGAFSTQLLAELGFETTWAPSAEAALQRLSENPHRYAAVFSDVVMPGMNGVELGLEIRRQEPELPVILTSGYSHVLAQEGSYGFELLHKPYSIEDLTRALRRAIDSRSAPKAATYYS
ncbi:PAS domain-containing sensor histidine kinase [uncultured Sphingomonas sp.]|uniref:hybrid sensor histidine kinase/response regulator n=1 Tax=uncultured Sphingomonas sp. TaxID=158754 RepID=UPI0026351DFD|nr:PAS domain-containing sensor histidine kinase [uncultured Sphingomonas sp.]